MLFSSVLVLGMLFLSACGSAFGTSSGVQIQMAPTIAPQLSAPTPAQPPVSSGTSNDLLAAYQGTLEQIYTTVSPSVVNIRVVQQVDASNLDSTQIPGFPFFDQPQGGPAQPQFQSGLGSGFVWDQQGHIVTNNHVVAGADKVEVTFSDGTIVPASLVGADPDSDLAVIKVDLPADQLHPVQMGDSTSVKVGELAIAIGNPFGLEGSMTTGIISAVGRSLPADETSAQSYTIPDVIQTDAPINPGNSGGILLNAHGQVLGVTSAIESPVRANAGVGFAIPSAIVQNVVPALIDSGKYVHSWLGISGTTLTPDLAKAMNLDASQRGALVTEVMPNSPAEKAGLRGSDQQTTIDGIDIPVGGDVITSIDNERVLQMDDLIAYLARTKVDQKVSLTILRDGKEQSLDVTLAARPASQEQANNQNETRGVRLGILGATVDAEIAHEAQLPDGTQGVLVQEVQPGSLAHSAGLRGGDRTVTLNGQQVKIGGDVITAVNGQAIASTEELRAALGQLLPDQNLTLTILRAGEQMEITLHPGQ